jgi:hypothetical protein
MRWRTILFQVWFICSILWCLAGLWVVYTGAEKEARVLQNFALETAKNECASEPTDKIQQCIKDRAAALEVKYDATVGGSLGQSFSEPKFIIFLLLALIGQPLVVLLCGVFVDWIVRRVRGA